MPKTVRPKKKSKKAFDPKKEVLVFWSCCAAILLLLVSAFNLNTFLNRENILGAKTEATPGKNSNNNRLKAFWEGFLDKNPSYFDGWIELANINLQLGNRPAAREAYFRAMQINPNSKKLANFKEVFASRN